MLTTTMQRVLKGYHEFSLWFISLGPWGESMILFGGAAIAVPLYYIIHYRASIKKKVQYIESRLQRGLLFRDKTNAPKKIIRCLELHPDFVQQNADDWNLISMGEYLSTLRPNTPEDDTDIPRLLERELEATVGSILLRSLGPRFGAAVLPMLGISKIESCMGGISANIASWIAAHLLRDMAESWDPLEDVAAFPLSVGEIISFVNINQKMRTTSNMETSSLEWMRRGEIGWDPSYYFKLEKQTSKDETTHDDDDDDKENTTKDDDVDLLPNPFIVEQHFDTAISGLEDRIRNQQRVTAPSATPNNAEPTTTTNAYDPDDRSFPKPTPINERILPGLYMGWGNVQCTHTKREILRNRLVAVLLTKLSYNYYLKEQGSLDLFMVKVDGKPCFFPDEFVQALMDTGHTIEVCPRSTITTFGIAACVKEDDGSWSNIPVAFFFRTGYENRYGRPAYFSAPHGGLSLSMQGPLLGKDKRCDIQYYVAIDGLCGWHSDHNPDAPWLKPVSTTEIYNPEQTLRAVRMAGLLGVTFNGIATEMNLPFGGYGVLGVCNDSAAIVDFALRGETNMYPLISTGRFLFHTARRLLVLQEGLAKDAGMEIAMKDLGRLVTAACNMDSDIHNSPARLIGATRRYLANNPVSYFQLTEDSKNMMSSVAKLYEKFVIGEEKRTEGSQQDSQVSNFVSFLFNSVPQKSANLIKN